MPEEHCMSVSRYADVIVARRHAKELAKQIGFSPEHQEQITLVVSELASNLIKYVGRGIINLKAIAGDDRMGILIATHDQGTGFDVDKAVVDGYSSAGTLGIGLGAVKRMVDTMDISSRMNEPSGTDIICKKWLPISASEILPKINCPLDIGIVSQPKSGFEVNGDAFVMKRDAQGNCLLAVIDGVGHGHHAHQASLMAKEYIENHGLQSLPEIFRGVERACKSTSGVVMAIAAYHHAEATITFASVGNIETKIIGSQDKYSLVIRRGIVGRQAPSPSVSKHAWVSGLGLIMHSDGVSSRWNWSEFAHLADKPAQQIAEYMYRKLSKDSDDATLIFVK